MGKAKLEFISRITTSDGKVIERKVDASEGIPDPEDFDLSSEEGFLRQFDSFEKTVLNARNQIAKEATESYFEETSKKNK